METTQKVEANSLKKKHFQTLHNKVQSKYEEMQRKLEKSKSIDSLLFAGNDAIIKIGNYEEKKCIELEEAVPTQFETGIQLEKYISQESLIVKEIEVTNSYFEYVDTYFKEENNGENKPEIIKTLSGRVNDNDDFWDFTLPSPNNIATDTLQRASHYSLNEIEKESEEFSLPSTSPRKISIRSKIGSRINAARERRRRKSLEKVTITKEKKKEAREKVEKLVLSNTTKLDIKYKRVKEATVTIALIEARGLVEVENQEHKTRMLYCRFRLGSEKQKSKAVKSIETKAEWSELVSLSLYKHEENILEISLWDRDTLVGRKSIDLSTVDREKTHKMVINIEEMPSIELTLLLTVTGTCMEYTTFDFNESLETKQKVETMAKELTWYRLKEDYSDVGCLAVFVYGAMGLSGQDCHCVLELDNNRLQTPTENKTSDPNWMKMFTFVVRDVTSVLEISIHDEKRSEGIGKLSIALLKIKNGEKKWYALKDESQREKAKGHNPRILIEMSLSWNLFKAALRVVHPKEVKYLQTREKLDRHVFSRNLTRAKSVINWVLGALQVINYIMMDFEEVPIKFEDKTCFEWEDARLNFIATIIWLLGCWFIKIWMLPLILLIPFLCYCPEEYYLISLKKVLIKLNILNKNPSKMAEIEMNKEKEEKTSIRQKINSLQEMVQSVQEYIGKLASFGESVKNLFNFTVPYLSYLAIFLILLIALVMYFIPIQYILMAWSIRKFTRKKLQPNAVPNNEILDLLSRVPNDETLLDCKELPVEETNKIII